MVRIYFEEVKLTGHKYVTVDGKRRRRSKTFAQTINPFNKNPDGSVKTRQQVRESVAAELRRWQES